MKRKIYKLTLLKIILKRIDYNVYKKDVKIYKNRRNSKLENDLTKK